MIVNQSTHYLLWWQFFPVIQQNFENRETEVEPVGAQHGAGCTGADERWGLQWKDRHITMDSTTFWMLLFSDTWQLLHFCFTSITIGFGETIAIWIIQIISSIYITWKTFLDQIYVLTSRHWKFCAKLWRFYNKYNEGACTLILNKVKIGWFIFVVTFLHK